MNGLIEDGFMAGVKSDIEVSAERMWGNIDELEAKTYVGCVVKGGILGHLLPYHVELPGQFADAGNLCWEFVMRKVALR
jgi:hypothetical protein